jgi:hypothetical protein
MMPVLLFSRLWTTAINPFFFSAPFLPVLFFFVLVWGQIHPGKQEIKAV